MGVFDDIRRTFAAKSASSVDLGTAVAEAARVEAEGGDELRRLREHMASDAFLLSSDVERAAIRERVTAAEQRLSEAALFRERLEVRLSKALTDEEYGRRKTAYEAAKAQRDAARKELAKVYPDIVRRFTTLQAVLQQAESALVEANAKLPEGAPILEGVEDYRDAKGDRKEILQDEVFDVWCWVDGGRVRPRDIPLIKTAKDGSHVIYNKNTGGPLSISSGGSYPVEKRPFRHLRWREAYPARDAERIAQIKLPDLTPLKIDLSAVPIGQSVEPVKKTGDSPNRVRATKQNL